MRTIELPLSRNYVRQWGVPEAVRELIQNAIDSNSPFEYSFLGDSLTIASRYDTLDLKTLILGSTSKADQDDKIGSFGEGYKIALLVLAREGLEVLVRNGPHDWRSELRHSDTYGDEVLHIDVTETDRINTGLEFVVKGLSHSESNSIYESCLLMQPMMEDIIETPRGNILPDRPGKLYVGGLYVCETDMTYGYDMKPEFITLERDRKTVDGWDLKNQAKEMWFSTQRWDEIAEKMSQALPDLAYAEYGCPELVKEACYRHFTKENPGSMVVSSQKEMDAAVAKGMTKIVNTGSGAYFHGISTSKSYLDSTRHIVLISTPKQYLQDWADRNQRSMSHPLRIAFKAVVSKSSDWRTK